MHLQGHFDVPSPQNAVYQALTDPNRFSRAIPDLQSLQVKDDKAFVASFKIGLGMIRGTMKMDMRFQNLVPGSQVEILGHGGGLQSTVDIVIRLHIGPSNEGTEVEWDSDANVGGLVASVGSRLIQTVADQKVSQIIKNLKDVLADPSKGAP